MEPRPAHVRLALVGSRGRMRAKPLEGVSAAVLPIVTPGFFQRSMGGFTDWSRPSRLLGLSHRSRCVRHVDQQIWDAANRLGVHPHPTTACMEDKS